MRNRRSLPIALAFALTAALTLGVASVSAQRAFVAKIELTGAAEVPGPGDPDASGEAKILIVPANGLVCWQLSWSDVDGTVVAAHIHGPADLTESAGVLVPLSVDPAKGCTRIDTDLAATIADTPSMYYVNVHSAPDFPGGAIRGQLD